MVVIETKHLFPVLDEQLITLLQSLSTEDWHTPTIAKQWTVKDIAAHLLDGNIKMLSFVRDEYRPPIAAELHSYTHLVTYINTQNQAWVNAAKKISPQLLIELLATTGQQFCNTILQLPPFEEAIFPVAWAGQEKSANWFHIAREYTEKFIHQQQIREAVGKQALFTKQLFQPFINTLLYALPHSFRHITAAENTTIQIEITTAIGGIWYIVKTATTWVLTTAITTENKIEASIAIPPTVAWKIFSKALQGNLAKPLVEIKGNIQLATQVLHTVAVMA